MSSACEVQGLAYDKHPQKGSTNCGVVLHEKVGAVVRLAREGPRKSQVADEPALRGTAFPRSWEVVSLLRSPARAGGLF